MPGPPKKVVFAHGGDGVPLAGAGLVERCEGRAAGGLGIDGTVHEGPGLRLEAVGGLHGRGELGVQPRRVPFVERSEQFAAIGEVLAA